jgi:predicted RNA-binding Zn-ribbon protein involved in translation (DUF1610 family)
MDNLKLNKGLLLLGFLITMTTLLSGVVLIWIDDKDFSKLEAIIKYKWMLLFLLIIISSLIFVLVYSKMFVITKVKQTPEKICPSCGEPKLKVVNSSVRSFSYKCSACGFDHKELKEGQTNINRNITPASQLNRFFARKRPIISNR